MRNSPFVDIAGQTFGKWVAIKRIENRHKAIYYLCQCKCGIQAAISKKALVYGKSLCCGCSNNRQRLRPKFGKPYSPADEYLIRLWYPKNGTRRLSGFLGRPRTSIIHKARRLGVKFEKKPKRHDTWTEQEVAVLNEHYTQGGVAACLPYLPNRTKHAIWVKAGKLKIYYNAVERKRAA